MEIIILICLNPKLLLLERSNLIYDIVCISELTFQNLSKLLTDELVLHFTVWDRLLSMWNVLQKKHRDYETRRIYEYTYILVQ